MISLFSKLFIKDYKNTADPRVRRAYGTMVSILGMILNLILFAAKFFVGMLTGSVAIRADAVNNLSDAGSQMLSFVSFRISSKPADREHPYGHGRFEYVASLIVSFLILHIGLDLLVESVQKILSPQPPSRSWLSVGVLGASVAIKLWIAYFNTKIGKRINSAVMKATATDSLSDVLSTGAVLLTTLVMLIFPDLTWNLDAYVGVIVAVLIMVSGAKILLEAKDSLLGGAPSEEIVRQITEVADSCEGVLGLHDLEVHNYGPGHVIAALHVEVDGEKDIFESHDMVDNLEKRLRRECGIFATIHMDPIVTNDEEVNLLRDRVKSAVDSLGMGMNVHDFRFVRGHTHTNLIFDVAVPFECPLSEDEVRRAVSSAVSLIDPSYFTVITVDRF
ncbi:MAG: cation transporter [Clostridia bacterium]|nr:cation transporter [Clostridia bacterium]